MLRSAVKKKKKERSKRELPMTEACDRGVGHGEIPERLIDLVKKNKGIEAPAPPCSTWACGTEAVTVKFVVRRSKKKFLYDS